MDLIDKQKEIDYWNNEVNNEKNIKNKYYLEHKLLKYLLDKKKLEEEYHKKYGS